VSGDEVPDLCGELERSLQEARRQQRHRDAEEREGNLYWRGLPICRVCGSAITVEGCRCPDATEGDEGS
jgi:hypothetical protein